MNIKDCRDRNIGERIIVIKYGDSETYYITGKELFRFQDTAQYTVDRDQSKTINSNYHGWQNLEHGPYWIPDGLQDDHGINECGVDKHSYSEVGYWEEFYNQPIQIKFYKDDELFLQTHAYLSDQHSPEVKRKLLKAHGFEYCGTRKFWKPYDEKKSLLTGFMAHDRGSSIWIHPETGICVTYEIADTVLFDDPIIIKVLRGDRIGFSFGASRGGYSVSKKERRDKNGYMTIVKYHPGYNIPWALRGTNQWNLGIEGFHEIRAFDYDEFQMNEPENKYWEKRNKMGKEFVALAEEYPLLKQVVF